MLTFTGISSISRKGSKRSKKKRSSKGRSKKSFSIQNILGTVPKWGLAISVGGVLFFLLLNAYLAMTLSGDPDDQHSLPISSLPELWKNRNEIFKESRFSRLSPSVSSSSSSCPSYGCLVFPPEYLSNIVNQSIQHLNNHSDVAIPFGSWDSATLLTRKSNRQDPPFNQDSAVAIHPFYTRQTTLPTDFLIGIFDGHGADGHITSQYFVKDVPARLAEKLNNYASPASSFVRKQQQFASKKWVIQQLKDTFVEAEAGSPKDVKERGGCTASVALRLKNWLFFANAGDSRTVLVSVNSSQFQIVEQGPAPGVTELYMTRADKPHLPEEKARIEAAGGKVHIPPQNPNLSRVIVYSDVFNDTIGLAMSRSLGDYEWTVKGVTPEPLVDVIDLNDLKNITNDPSSSLFVIAASDGMWDLRLKQWYEKQFAESFLKKGDKRRVHPLIKMQQVIAVASPKNEKWYRDDITGIIMPII